MTTPIKMFISHTWMFHQDACQKKIVFFEQFGLEYELIEPYENLEVDIENDELLAENMKRSNCLLILAGVTKDSEKSVAKEIDCAKKYGVPIIAIQPWTQKDTKEVIKDNANIIVGWHGKAITDAIRNTASY